MVAAIAVTSISVEVGATAAENFKKCLPMALGCQLLYAYPRRIRRIAASRAAFRKAKRLNAPVATPLPINAHVRFGLHVHDSTPG